MADYRSCPGFNWQLDVASRELVRDDGKVRLPEKPYLVLMALLDAGGDVVSRQSLQQKLWADDTFVDFDNNLNTAVATLRQALGDSARAPRYIETLPRIGYRLLTPTAPVSSRERRMSIGVLAGTAALTLVAMTVGYTWWPRETRLPPVASIESSPEVANLVAQGRYLRGQFEARQQPRSVLAQAREAFRAASELDPSSAEAIAEEADTVVDMSFAGSVSMLSGLSEARELAERALQIDENTAAAHRVLGMTNVMLDWDYLAAERHIDRAEILQPQEARTAMARAMHASGLGQYDVAVEAARRAVTLEPESFFVRADLAFFYLAAGRNAEAAESSRDVLAVAPDFAPALVHAVTANERLGRWADAARAARALMSAGGATTGELAALDAMAPRDAVARWRRWDLHRTKVLADGQGGFAFALALKYAAIGEDDAALDQLETAHAARNAWVPYLNSFPEFGHLHGNPRFDRLVRAIAGTATPNP